MTETAPQVCSECKRPRQVSAEHPMDAYDYNPMQAVLGTPFGWYDGRDAGEGNMCPQWFTKLFRTANGL